MFFSVRFLSIRRSLRQRELALVLFSLIPCNDMCNYRRRGGFASDTLCTFLGGLLAVHNTHNARNGGLASDALGARKGS